MSLRIIKANSVTYENRVSVQALDRISLSEGSIEDVDYVDNILPSIVEKFSKLHRDKNINPRSKEDIIRYIKDNLILVLIDNSYLIGIDVIESYFSTDVIMTEEFIFRLDGKENFKAIVQTLDLLKDNLGANKIQVGTLACATERQHLALSRLYQRQGFVISNFVLEK